MVDRAGQLEAKLAVGRELAAGRAAGVLAVLLLDTRLLVQMVEVMSFSKSEPRRAVLLLYFSSSSEAHHLQLAARVFFFRLDTVRPS